MELSKLSATTTAKCETTTAERESYTCAEVAQHKSDGWFILWDKVYNMSSWLASHPGGDQPVYFAGKDATEVFALIHGPEVLRKNERFVVGNLSSTEKVSKAKYAEKRDREFDDHMAPQGETSHIATIVLALLCGLAAWSWVAWRWAGAELWVMLVYYIAGMLALWLWHFCCHKPWSPMYEEHMSHHLERYPATRFYGAEPDTVKKDMGSDCPTFLELLNPFKTITMEIKHEGPAYLLMLLILTGGYLCGNNVVVISMAFFMFVVMGSVGNAIHMSFHVKNFEFEKYAWYMELRSLHYIHHLGDACANFLLVNVGFDDMLGSLRVSDPLKSKGKSANLKLPAGIHISRTCQHAGLSAAVLGLHIPMEAKIAGPRSSAQSRGYSTVLVRLVLVVTGLYLWFATEAGLLGAGAGAVSVDWVDHGHRLAEPLREYMVNLGVFEQLCNLSLLVSEVSGVGLIVVSVMGSSFRPFLATWPAFLIRLFVASTGQLPVPAGTQFIKSSYMPTVLAVNGADEFLSARVILASIVAVELCRFSVLSRSSAARWGLKAMATCLVAFQVAITLAARTNFTFDVVFAIAVGRYATLLAGKYVVCVDAFMP